MNNTRLYLNEKKFLKDINKLKDVTIYVLKGFDEKLLGLHHSGYRRLRETIKKNNITIIEIDSKIKANKERNDKKDK